MSVSMLSLLCGEFISFTLDSLDLNFPCVCFCSLPQFVQPVSSGFYFSRNHTEVGRAPFIQMLVGVVDFVHEVGQVRAA